MSKKKVGIIGQGSVGSALARGLQKVGYEVKTAGKDQNAVRDAASSANIVILAVPFGELDATIKEAGKSLDGKIVVDVTNAIGPGKDLAVGFTTSGAEELQKKIPQSKVVKAFNTVFAKFMDSGRVDGKQLTAFIAGDDARAKSEVMELARDIGFDAVDSGPLKNARMLEPMAYLNIQLGYGQKMGTDIGFQLIRAA